MTDTLKYIDVNPDEAKRMAQRLHVKKDDIRLVRKGYEVKIEDQNDDERTITARVSTADRDRDDEIVEPKGIDLKDYQRNPVLGWAHKYDHPAVGKALWSKTDADGLICKFQFAETQFADELYQLYKDGFMKAFSIGFIPMEYDQKSKTHQKISLLEVSCVLVPANQSALVMEAYQKGLIKSEALKKDLGLDVPDEAAKEAEGEDKAAIVTKPEVTDEYVRIPVSEGHEGHKIRTITVSAGEGIKALYCIDDKEIITYLFDKDKWSMDEARAWVDEHQDDKLAAALETKDEASPPVLDIAVLFDKLNARFDALEARLQPPPAPLAEARIDPPAPPDPGDYIEIDEPENIIEFDESAKPAPPAVAPAPAPKELTLDEVKASVANAIDGLDIKGIVDKSIKDNLDRLRGRVR
jgi:HK97 family phage prohead protease